MCVFQGFAGLLSTFPCAASMFLFGLFVVENYLGHFLEKLQNIWKKYKQLPAKRAREARPFVAEAVFLYFFHIFLQFLQKMAQVVFHTICYEKAYKNNKLAPLCRTARRGI